MGKGDRYLMFRFFRPEKSEKKNKEQQIYLYSLFIFHHFFLPPIFLYSLPAPFSISVSLAW